MGTLSRDCGNSKYSGEPVFLLKSSMPVMEGTFATWDLTTVLGGTSQDILDGKGDL